jgi:hypothetical protein
VPPSSRTPAPPGDVSAGALNQELDGTRVHVADGLGEADGVRAQPLPQARVQRRRGRDLHDLLVPPLHRAVALVEVDRVPGGVGEHLHLDVPRPDDGLLEEHRRVAERAAGLAHGRREHLRQRRGVRHLPHAAPAAARDGLHEQREPDVVRRGDELVDVGRRRRRAQHRDPGLARRRDRAHLVAGQREDAGRRPDERDARRLAGARQLRVLGEEAVARVDGVRAGLARDADDLVDVEVRAHRVAALADEVRLVGLDAVDGAAVLPREHRDGAATELVRRAERAHRDLAAVGDEDLGEHRSLSPGRRW